MKRISTSTAQANKFGTGKNGFTYGDPPGTPPTEVDDTWLDHVQEALARTVELDGKALDSADYEQMADSVLGMTKHFHSTTQGARVSGLTWGSVSGLNATLAAGIYYANGRRYNVTASQIHAGDAPRTFPDNATTYVYIEPHATDDYDYVITTGASLAPAANKALIAVITTSGGSITSNIVGPFIALAPLRLEGNYATSGTVNIGDQSRQTDGSEGRVQAFHGKVISLGENNADGTRDEVYQYVHVHTITGPDVDEFQINNIGPDSNYGDRDALYLEIRVVGKRTDADATYSAHKITAAIFDSGTGDWVFDGGGGTVVHESGSGGGTRDVNFVLLAGVPAVQYDVDNAETWRFVTVVTMIRNQG